MSYEFPAAQPHGAIQQLFDDVYFVSGSITMPLAVPMRFSRNMTIVRRGESLCLINSMRLTDAGLAELDALGKVEHVIRIAGFHGMDDPFYKDRYGAKVWAVKGAPYARGFTTDPKPEHVYFTADEELDAGTALPIEGASVYMFRQEKMSEALLRLDREGGILVSGDSLQHWHKADEYFNFPAKVVMKLMGFLKPHNVGPGWRKSAKPNKDDLRGVLDLEFEHVLPVHGAAVIGGARAAYRRSIEAATR